VDGQPETRVGTKVDPRSQEVEIDGRILRPDQLTRSYYLLNKPSGVVCTNELRENRPRAVDLVTDTKKGRIYTVGRLDEDSKGLILLTSDGDFAQRVAHPRYGVSKTYVVKVRGRIDDAAVQRIREGVHLSEGRTTGARILVLKRTNVYSTLSVTLREGMNREIRRAFARVGSKVVDLKRTRIGPLTERGLRIGRWRALSGEEVEALLEEADEAQASQRRGAREKTRSKPATGRGKRT
jgi:23S rRNA pseudouridine2605 synthase